MTEQILALSSELDAVNSMLGAIGEAPVNTLAAGTASDAKIALKLLREENTIFQTQGWSFNREEEFELSPDQDGFINLPANVLEVDLNSLANYNWQMDLVRRGSRLYDRKNHTYKIGLPVKLDLTFLLPFEELPQSARTFVFMRAAVRFQARYLGDPNQYQFTKDDAQSAWASFLNAEADAADWNVVKHSPETAMTLRRRYRYR